MRTLFNSFPKVIKVGFCFIFAVLSMPSISTASHIVGGEIYYQWLSGNTYTVTLSFYRDCGGIPAGNAQTINYVSSSCASSGSVVISQIGIPEQVSPICAASLPLSSCNGGSLYGVEKYVYQGNVTLPGNCADWIFSFNECCRNSAITNLSNGAGFGSYFSSRLNNLDVPFNNSVAFGNVPYSIISNNATTQLSWNTYDTDGDSLTYELVAARDFNGTMPVVIPYAPGYTYQQPFLSSLPTSLNFSNGILEVSPNQIQVSVVCMKVSEYRTGILVGEVYRDYQVVVDNSTNNPPSLTGMNGTANYVTNGCPGDTITFNVIGTDPDLGQDVTLSMNNLGTNSTFTATTAPVSTGTFSWIPVTSEISASAYTFIITAIDDNCDFYGTYSQAYQVYVNGCNTNNVWPGDANSDGNANLYDLLPIGIAYNNNGPVRPSASLNWIAQPAIDWANNFISGINHKHADTDGNGNINLDDTTAIFQNYGLNHPLRVQNSTTTSVADLSVTANADTVGLSSIINFDVALTTPVDSIYGLAFRLYFDPSIIDLNSISVTYFGSVFGINAVDMIKIDRSQGMNGFVDIALTRINQNQVTGTGPVARVTIVTTDNVSGKVVLNLTPFDIIGTTQYESIVNLSGIGDGVVIDPNYVGAQELNISQQVQLFPTPAKDFVNFMYSGSELVSFLQLYDVTGKEVLHILNPISKSRISLIGILKGTYILKAVIGDNTIYKKIMVF